MIKNTAVKNKYVFFIIGFTIKMIYTSNGCVKLFTTHKYVQLIRFIYEYNDYSKAL